MAATSGRVPRMFDAPVTATTRVLSLTSDRTSSAVRMPVLGSNSAQRTVAPVRSAYVTHGRTLPSWSSRVTTTSSPGPHDCARVRATWNVSSVMLRPNTMPAGSPFTRSAPARRAPTVMSSALRSAWVVRPRFDSPAMSAPAMAAATTSGVCVPPGSVEVGGAVGEGGDAGADAVDVVGHEATSHQMVATSRGRASDCAISAAATSASRSSRQAQADARESHPLVVRQRDPPAPGLVLPQVEVRVEAERASDGGQVLGRRARRAGRGPRTASTAGSCSTADDARAPRAPRGGARAQSRAARNGPMSATL